MTGHLPVSSALPSPFASDLVYIEAELAWIEARCVRIALERRRDVSADDREAGRGGFGEGARETPGQLADRIKAARGAEDRLRSSIDDRLVVHRLAGPELALDRLARLHDLDAFERTALLLAAAPCAARRFDRLYAGLEAERHHALTIDAVFSFAELSFAERIARRASLGPHGRLVSNDLVEVSFAGRTPLAKDLLGTEVELRGRIFAYLLGDPSIGDELAERVRIEEPRATFDRVVMPAADKRRILAVIERHDRFLAARRAWGLDLGPGRARGVLMLFHGPSGCGKTLAAHAVASSLGKRVLKVDLSDLAAQQDPAEFIGTILREARLLDAIALLDEAESMLRSRRDYGNPSLAALLPALERFEGVIVLTTNLVEMIDDAVDRRVLVKVRFDKPGAEAREALWRVLIPPQLPISGDVDVSALATRYDMSGGHIENAVIAAAARAVHETPDGQRVEVTHAMLEDAAREQSVERGVTHADRERRAREVIDAPTGGRAGFR